MVTRDDVAKRAGVSPATVSYVINEGPRPVSAEARAKVLRAIEETGYEPSQIARSLRLKKTNTIAIILPDNGNPFFASLERAISEASFSAGYSLITCHSAWDVDRESGFVSLIRSKQVDGVILVPAGHQVPALERLAHFKIPVVVVDRSAPNGLAPCVRADDFAGGKMAAEHLLALGHRRIVCITRPTYLEHIMDRSRGYLAALQQHGVETRPEWIVQGGFSFEGGVEAGRQILKLQPRPTAIFAYNDVHAIGAMHVIVEAGLRVPADISIVGFDDIPEASYTNPALTTVTQPRRDMGRMATELLVRMIAGGNPPRKNRIVLKTELIVRGSTAPPRPESRSAAGTRRG